LKVILARDLRAASERLAEANRSRFRQQGVLAVNIMGSPGAGKTALLEATLPRLHPRYGCMVVEGDIATTRDGARIAALSIPVVQLQTGGACHLDPAMVARALEELPGSGRLLFVENVGNLVCPAEVDIGTDRTVVVFSVTEGPDKPEKYPLAFSKADAVVLSKVDLLPHLDLTREDFLRVLGRCAPSAAVFPLSARTGEGVDAWCAWIEAQITSQKSHAPGEG
jgi:hydrogenase nickel incorporation protein HypB